MKIPRISNQSNDVLFMHLNCLHVFIVILSQMTESTISLTQFKKILFATLGQPPGEEV